ncbi:MAG: hypothetical protein GEU73_07765 [Chloroflexi bacterium]|nr:hypothetical protein [Chloroflexota bacterium]
MTDRHTDLLRAWGESIAQILWEHTDYPDAMAAPYVEVYRVTLDSIPALVGEVVRMRVASYAADFVETWVDVQSELARDDYDAAVAEMEREKSL